MIFISCLSRGVRGVKGVSGIRESRAEKTARLFAFSHWLLVRLKNLGSLANAILPNLIKFPKFFMALNDTLVSFAKWQKRQLLSSPLDCAAIVCH